MTLRLINLFYLISDLSQDSFECLCSRIVRKMLRMRLRFVLSIIISFFSLVFFFPLCEASPILNAGPISKHSENSGAPLQIHSDYANFDQKTGNVVHRGHVVATQGSRILKSDTLIIHRNEIGKIDNILSEGVPAYFEFSEDPQKSKIIGHANILHYFPKENKILLKNAAELKQDNNTIQAATITYYFNTGKLVTDSNQEERTTVIINSKNGV